MPRKPRMYLPDVPAHIVQRGNNRDACFFSDDDYLYYLEVLGQRIIKVPEGLFFNQFEMLDYI